MKRLFPGQMSQEEFHHLHHMTGLRSEAVKESLYNHIVKGESPEVAILTTGVKRSNLSRDLEKFEALYEQVQIYNEICGVKRVV